MRVAYLIVVGAGKEVDHIHRVFVWRLRDGRPFDTRYVNMHNYYSICIKYKRPIMGSFGCIPLNTSRRATFPITLEKEVKDKGLGR